jgi:hypothetical protein
MTLSPLLCRGERERRRALTRLLPLLHGVCGGEGRGEEARFMIIGQFSLLIETRALLFRGDRSVSLPS